MSDVPDHFCCCSCKYLLDLNAKTHSCEQGDTMCSDCMDNKEDAKCSCGDVEVAWKPMTIAMKTSLDNLRFTCLATGCGQVVSIKGFNYHVNNVCKFSAQCPDCKQHMNKNKLKTHKKDFCSSRIVKCPWCFAEGPAKEMDEHKEDLLLCAKKFANLKEHPLVNTKKRKVVLIPEHEDENEQGDEDDDCFIVPDGEELIEQEPKKAIEKQWDEWRANKRH